MLETILVLVCTIVGVFFCWDIKRRTVAHQSTITAIKSKIATETGMTTHFAAFQQGPNESVLLAASSPHDQFWYYKIIKNKATEHYTIPLHAISSVQVMVNNSPVKVTTSSVLPSATLRAAEISRQEVQRMGESAKRVTHMSLLLEYQSEKGSESQQISLYQALNSTKNVHVVKLLLNSIWWQQYLREFIGKRAYAVTDSA